MDKTDITQMTPEQRKEHIRKLKREWYLRNRDEILKKAKGEYEKGNTTYHRYKQAFQVSQMVKSF